MEEIPEQGKERNWLRSLFISCQTAAEEGMTSDHKEH